jgi:hypothetical protein
MPADASWWTIQAPHVVRRDVLKRIAATDRLPRILCGIENEPQVSGLISATLA